MGENILIREPINNLIGRNFFIPDYQRGYRWQTQQVEELLEDIISFSDENKRDEFYCLQPIIVKDNKGKWEVIDGQQRLTTIFIILKYLGQPTFSIEYQTRGESESFLERISEQVDDSNVDFYHMSLAFKTVKQWFEEKQVEENRPTLKSKFFITLGEKVEVIWYDVKDGTDAREIFTRINIGKIPLNNAELVKALLLSSDNFKEAGDRVYLKQLEIANEWDQMEYSLRDPAFWYFINKNINTADTRIEFIFNLVAKKPANSEDKLFTFHAFSKKLKVPVNQREKQLEKEWGEVKHCYGLLREWFEDWVLFHLTGFLITAGEELPALLKDAENNTKKIFKDELYERINKHIGKDWMDLRYGAKDNHQIQNVLLLFNILSILRAQDKGTRFAFYRYKGEGDIKRSWSLEHIHAQQSKGLNTQKQWEAWLDEHRSSLERIDAAKNSKLIEKIVLTDVATLTKEQFELLYEEVLAVYKSIDAMQEDELHHISNLALLDSRANSSLNNSVFEVKRQLIIRKEKTGEFIPLCTRNAFLKYYSTNAGNLYYWSKPDRLDYFREIKDLIKSIPQNQESK